MTPVNLARVKGVWQAGVSEFGLKWVSFARNGAQIRDLFKAYFNTFWHSDLKKPRIKICGIWFQSDPIGAKSDMHGVRHRCWGEWQSEVCEAWWGACLGKECHTHLSLSNKQRMADLDQQWIRFDHRWIHHWVAEFADHAKNLCEVWGVKRRNKSPKKSLFLGGRGCIPSFNTNH